MKKISELSNQLGITSEDYINQCKIALTNNGGHENFIYVVDDNVFRWKKTHRDMKITFGTIRLTSVPVIETFHDVLNVCAGNYYHLKEKVIQLQREKEVLENDNKELLVRITDCIKLKNDMETQLYSQFLSILNTKKRKIIQLEKKLKSNGLEVVENEEEADEDMIVDEEKDKEKRELYECETEVETDDSDCEEKKEQEKSTKVSSKNESFDFDSDSGSHATYNLPKRCKTLDKLSGGKKNIKDENEMEMDFIINSNVFKSKNCKISNGKEINQYDDGAGPSGLKIAKLKNANNDKCSEKGNQVQSDISSMKEIDKKRVDNMKEISGNSSGKVLPNEDKKSTVIISSSKSVSTITEDEKKGIIIDCKSSCQVKKNSENVSAVDDILSKLLA